MSSVIILFPHIYIVFLLGKLFFPPQILLPFSLALVRSIQFHGRVFFIRKQLQISKQAAEDTNTRKNNLQVLSSKAVLDMAVGVGEHGWNIKYFGEQNVGRSFNLNLNAN